VIGLAGLLAFLLLHLFFILRWSWFTASSWPGYEAATARGLIEPWFVHTPRSFWLTRAVFVGMAALIAFVRRSSRLAAALALWLGSGMGVVFTYSTTSMPSLEWGYLGYLMYPVRIGLPVLIGTAMGALLVRAFEKLAARSG
jgi:hypothetical protein